MIRSCSLSLAFLLLVTVASAEPDRRAADRKALTSLGSFVGDWKGVGRARPGSAKGAWTEKQSWAWRFGEGRAWLVFSSAKSRFFKSGELRVADKPGRYELEVKTPEGKTERFEGGLERGGLRLLASKRTEAGRPTLIAIKFVADGARMVMRLERQIGKSTRTTRLAELGLTRKGSGFAKGAGGPECIVTGGLAKMKVSYKGKSYDVCCGGCKALFEEDPEAVLAEWRERLAEEKKAAAEDDE